MYTLIIGEGAIFISRLYNQSRHHHLVVSSFTIINVKLITSPQEALNSFSLWLVCDFLLIIFKLSSLKSLVRSHYSIHASGNYSPKDVPLPLWIGSHDKLKTSTDWRLYVVPHSLQLQSFNIIQVWFTGVGGNNRTKHPGQYTNIDRYQPVIYKMNKHEHCHHREYTVLSPLFYPHTVLSYAIISDCITLVPQPCYQCQWPLEWYHQIRV